MLQMHMKKLEGKMGDGTCREQTPFLDWRPALVHDKLGVTMQMEQPLPDMTMLSPATAIREKPASPWGPEGLAERVEFLRLDASRRLDPARRSEMGQFLTPAPAAELVASMFANRPSSLRVLDPGAGVGSLTAALVAHLIRQKLKPREIYVTRELFPGDRLAGR